jgi:transcriptional regulator with XRE-family HTH domain
MQNSIKAKREERGLSRSELAQKMQVDFSTIWRWEEEQVDVPWDSIFKLATILNYPPIELVPALKTLPSPLQQT